MFLAIHSIFLGIKFDIQIFKLLRRIVLLLFIIFEIIAQGILVYHFFKIKEKISDLINKKILTLKAILVLVLATIAILSVPILIEKEIRTSSMHWSGIILSELYYFIFLQDFFGEEPHKFLGFRPEI